MTFHLCSTVVFNVIHHAFEGENLRDVLREDMRLYVYLLRTFLMVATTLIWKLDKVSPCW